MVLLLLAGLAFLFPIALYCLFLAVVNARENPSMVSGPWDFLGVLFATYNALGAGAALVIPYFVRRYGIRQVHRVNLWIGSVGLLSMMLIREPEWLLVSMIGINLDRWNKLPKDQQDLLTKAGVQTEQDTAKFGDEVLISENKKLDAAGVQVQKLSADKGKQIQTLFRSANWELAGACCGDAGKELQALAKKAGLAD